MGICRFNFASGLETKVGWLYLVLTVKRVKRENPQEGQASSIAFLLSRLCQVWETARTASG